MLGLLGDSPIEVFTRQTSILKNAFYDYGLDNNIVPASAVGDQSTEFDRSIKATGGGVLSPSDVKDIGVKIVEEDEDLMTWLCMFICDLDVSSMYPSIVMAFNIARETKLLSTLNIIDIDQKEKPIDEFFGLLSSPYENAVQICNDYFHLPSYLELSKTA
jgi:hypothetical protein